MEVRSAIVTGGSGFVGTSIVRALRERHPKCHITVVDVQGLNNGFMQEPNISFIQADITSPQNILDVLIKSQPEIVIHSAGIVPPLGERYSRSMEKDVMRVNVEGTRNTLHAAKAAHCAAFVYTSSCTVVTDDVSIDYANIDERWPVAYRSSIYGESKVV